MTTANKLTIFRVLLIPVFLLLAYAGKRIPRSPSLCSPASRICLTDT